MKKALMFLISFLFLIAPAFAYQEFNYNTNFTTTNAGVTLYANSSVPDVTNISIPIYGSCNGLINCANFTDVSALPRMYYIYMNSKDSPTTVPIYSNITLLHANAYTYMQLQANAIGVVVYDYNVGANAAADCTNYGGSLPQGIYVTTSNGTILNSSALQTTVGTAYNSTLIIPASSSARNLSVFYQLCSNGTSPYTFKLGKWKLLTFDLVEGNSVWEENDNDFVKFCGPGAQPLCGNNGLNNTINRWLIGLSEDKIPCMAVRMQNTTMAGLIDKNDSTGTTTGIVFPYNNTTTTAFGNINCHLQIFRMANHGWLWKPDMASSYLGFDFFLESLSSTSMKGTFLSDPVDGSWAAGRTYVFGYTNGNGQLFFGYTWTNQSNVPIQSINQSRITLALNTTPALPSGTQWRSFIRYSGGGANSSYYNFFNYPNICSNYGLICDEFTNNETVTDSNCNFVSTNYCGACGCEASGVWGSGCHVPTYQGTYCAGAQTYITSYMNCTTSTANCPSGTRCGNFKVTNPLSIYCFNDTSDAYQFCIDANGAQVNCSSIAGNTSIGCTNNATFCYDANCNPTNCTTATNPGNAGAVWLGSLLGVSDPAVAMAFVWLLASLAVSAIVTWYAKNSEISGKVFMGTMVAMLVAGAIIGWFPVIIMILLGGFLLLMVTGLAGKVFGGGG